jgi:hypothetical protein
MIKCRQCVKKNIIIINVSNAINAITVIYEDIPTTNP